MASLVVFLNEISWTFAGVHRNSWATHIQSAIAAVRSIRAIRPDLCIALERAPNAILLGDAEDVIPLGAVIGGGRYEDEWNLLRDVVQMYPSDICPEEFRPGPDEQVSWSGINAEAMAWANKANSFVISFGYPATWDQCQIEAVLNTTIPSPIVVKNIAITPHVEHWTNEIKDYGVDFSASSLIYEGADFAVRMYLNDHAPPHVHVFANAQSQVLLARLNVVTIELMEGTAAVLPIRSQLFSWAKLHQHSLRQNWERCRSGQLPTRIGNA
jgi:hypothetical protein